MKIESSTFKTIDIMPMIVNDEEFRKYLLKTRKELNINFRYDIKEQSLTIGNNKVYFYDIRSVMAYLEGYKEGVRVNGNES